jgi:hypothetical protein
MENNKVSFDKNELEKFLNETDLIIKSNALSRISGGTTFVKIVYKNYSESTFVNRILPGG